MILEQEIQTYKVMDKSGVAVEIKILDGTEDKEYTATWIITETLIRSYTDYYTREEAIKIAICDFMDRLKLTPVDGD